MTGSKEGEVMLCVAGGSGVSGEWSDVNRRPLAPVSSVPLHEAAQPFQRHLDLLVGRGVGTADEAAVGAESVAGDHRHPLLLEQTLGEGLVAQAAGGDRGEGGEGAQRLARGGPA